MCMHVLKTRRLTQPLGNKNYNSGGEQGGNYKGGRLEACSGQAEPRLSALSPWGPLQPGAIQPAAARGRCRQGVGARDESCLHAVSSQEKGKKTKRRLFRFVRVFETSEDVLGPWPPCCKGMTPFLQGGPPGGRIGTTPWGHPRLCVDSCGRPAGAGAGWAALMLGLPHSTRGRGVFRGCGWTVACKCRGRVEDQPGRGRQVRSARPPRLGGPP